MYNGNAENSNYYEILCQPLNTRKSPESDKKTRTARNIGIITELEDSKIKGYLGTSFEIRRSFTKISQYRACTTKHYP